ncbi:TPA: phosphatase PAP2/dual specificity phosphatase family protein [Pseudomonas aeruginosa]|uniref:phosphatase PAP2/dual specificity phosphatase family protein n=5 Tax=Pseudomonas aeruginosa TaxID=287 RepID=UPI0006277A70|nr:phosphatase PAP2/dual specificity phosphatase family protein [Pseudomonas aeruginosa]ELK4904757.1 phosphatase PAP2/dual specificity phosphatase family protein [Pseudomonas aeruginosa]KKJ43431.1 serine/threonine protein phosphatase [Pseudomonas aeruginosa MRSN 317]MBG6609237.1 phosphatase PAP2/dual specificity phosphatase family protein [Pseudomonas aeruginosa]MBI8779669.1 phosphatase PAP2/dual specificity phosphatase family protein [Pseudomonas aeruginosa]MBK3752912.1 serine/threonine prote
MAPREPGVLKRAVLWLLFLGPFFFASYGLANWLTSQRGDVGSLVFDWERGMPLWPWTILPYWSIDLLYGLSLLLPRDKRELDTHCLRLLSAQVLSVACFLLFPLRFTFERPELGGVFGWLFDVLMGFDKPFNQAPSLHIALLVVLWVCYARYASGAWRWLLHGWFALIGLSVLTTWQHHFIDVPTGALAGWLCVWLWPQAQPAPFARASLSRDRQRRRLAARYGLGALACAAVAFALGGAALWLCWPALALALVALNYLLFGAAGFQKGSTGRLSAATRWLLAPYLLAARVNAWLWTRRRPQPDEVLPGLWLGRLPSSAELADGRFRALLDATAELSCEPQGLAYRSLPLLDLVAPDVEDCRRAAVLIDELLAQGPLLVACALGYSRSATLVAAWLLLSGRAADVESAVAVLRRARPQVLLGEAQRRTLAALSGSVPEPSAELGEVRHA